MQVRVRYVSYLGRVAGQDIVCSQHAKVRVIDGPAPPATDAVSMAVSVGTFPLWGAPLTHMLKGKVRYVWSSECQTAFENVKAICTAPVLALPGGGIEPFQIEVDVNQVPVHCFCSVITLPVFLIGSLMRTT